MSSIRHIQRNIAGPFGWRRVGRATAWDNGKFVGKFLRPSFDQVERIAQHYGLKFAAADLLRGLWRARDERMRSKNARDRVWITEAERRVLAPQSSWVRFLAGLR